MKIVADNTVPFLKGIAEPIAEVKYLTSKEFTPENVQDADILIVRSIDKCTRELLEGSRVKLITSATIGFDHIDTRYCDKAGITWKNSPGCNAVSVAQYVLSGLVTIALRKGEPLQGKTIGIVGVGHVGKEVEKLCSAYGMNVLRNDPPRGEGGERRFRLTGDDRRASRHRHLPHAADKRRPFCHPPPGRRRLLPQAPTETLVRQRIQRSRP